MGHRWVLVFALGAAACVPDLEALKRGRLDAGDDAGTDLGTDASLPPDLGTDFGVDAGPHDAGALCERDAARCNDGLFCNGVETCDPSASGAMTNGCLPGARPCNSDAGQGCNETTMMCTTICHDADGDGHDAMSCGGDDCDDSDANRFPGNPEVCDVGNHDEDCNCVTVGAHDADGDGYTWNGCCNCVGTGMQTCGTDCNDMDASIHPGAPDPPGDGIDQNCDGSP